MTRQELERAFQLKVDIETRENLIKNLQSLKREQSKLAYECSLNNPAIYDRCPYIGGRRDDIDYIKLVKKDYNSKEVQFDVCEWNILVDSIIELQENKLKELYDKLEEL